MLQFCAFCVERKFLDQVIPQVDPLLPTKSTVFLASLRIGSRSLSSFHSMRAWTMTHLWTGTHSEVLRLRRLCNGQHAKNSLSRTVRTFPNLVNECCFLSLIPTTSDGKIQSVNSHPCSICFPSRLTAPVSFGARMDLIFFSPMSALSLG